MESLIFVVDSQPEVCDLARKSLEEAGYEVRTFSSLSDPGLNERPPTLIVVQIELLAETSHRLHWEASGDALSSRVRRLVLLEDGSAEQRLLAFHCGADDCIVKPLHAEELSARVRVMLCPSSPASWGSPGNVELVIDTWGMKLVVRGVEVPVTNLEFRLIEYLARHRGKVFTRDFLLDAVWGDMHFITPRSVDACVRRIREKIEADHTRPALLKTVRGVGYRFEAAALWRSAPATNCKCAACAARMSALALQPLPSKARKALTNISAVPPSLPLKDPIEQC